MEELGLVNDEVFAERYARKLLFTKNMSKTAAAFELARKGIDRELSEEILESIDVDEREQIREVIDKKYRNLSDEKIKRRAFSALQRLGYRFDDIRAVFEEYTEEDCI